MDEKAQHGRSAECTTNLRGANIGETPAGVPGNEQCRFSAVSHLFFFFFARPLQKWRGGQPLVAGPGVLDGTALQALLEGGQGSAEARLAALPRELQASSGGLQPPPVFQAGGMMDVYSALWQ
jgi:hypothetical protein